MDTPWETFFVRKDAKYVLRLEPVYFSKIKQPTATAQQGLRTSQNNFNDAIMRNFVKYCADHKDTRTVATWLVRSIWWSGGR